MLLTSAPYTLCIVKLLKFDEPTVSKFLTKAFQF